MQTTSNTWKMLVAQEGSRIEAKAIINGVEYTEISPPVISRALMQDGVSVGNVVSAVCTFSLETTDSIPKSAEVQIKMRMTDGAEENPVVSEWLPAGTYFISRRTTDPLYDVVTFECYDALLKAESVLTDVPWTNEDGEVITDENDNMICFSISYPCKMDRLAYDIANLLHVDVDIRTVLNSDYVLPSLTTGATLRDALSAIGAANGGNWIITPDNKLRLVPVVSADEADESEDIVEVEAVVNGITVGNEETITGIRVTTDTDTAIIGDATGAVVDVSIAQEIAEDLAEILIGVKCRPFALSGAFYDPAIELGDFVKYNTQVSSILNAEQITLGVNGDISSPDPAELADEYPYIGASQRTLNEAKIYAEEKAEQAVSEFDESLGQTSVFNRLTNNGSAQGIFLDNGDVYMNATYIQAGYLNADRIAAGSITTEKISAEGISADVIEGGTLTLGGQNDTSGTLKVKDASGNVIGTWNNVGITINKGTIAGPSITLGGSDNTSGTLTVKDASGNTIGTWDVNGISANQGNIGPYTIDSDGFYYTYPSGFSYSFRIINKCITFTSEALSDRYNYVFLGLKLIPGFQPEPFFEMTLRQDSDDTVFSGARIHPTGSIELYYDSGQYCDISHVAGSTHYAYLSKGVTIQGGSNTSDAFAALNIGVNSYSVPCIITDDRFYVYNDFLVTGTKSRVVSTDQYSDRLLYCYETPTPMFGDIGEGTISDDGCCYVWLDPVFAQTITTEQYQVFLQRYGNGDCYVSERRSNCFIVIGTPGLQFGWEIKAKQRDYDQKRLDKDGDKFNVPNQTYGENAAQHIQDIQKERV